MKLVKAVSSAVGIASLIVGLGVSAQAAPPAGAPPIGTASGEVKLNTSLSGSSLTFDYLFGGSTATWGNTAGTVRATSAVLLHSLSSTQVEAIYTRGASAADASAEAKRDTGLSSASTYGPGNPGNTNPTTFSLAGSGTAILCLDMDYRDNSNNLTEYWHCSASFTLPSQGQGQGQGQNQNLGYFEKVATSPNFTTRTITTNAWTSGVPSQMQGIPRMMIDIPSGQNSVTLTVSGLNGGSAVNMSNAQCFFLESAGQNQSPVASTTSTYNGVTLATLATSNATSSSVDCLLTSQGLIGADIYVGDPQGAYGSVPFWLNMASSGASNRRSTPATSPKYAGPEFSSFGPATLAGSKAVASGKKLDTITSLKVNGSAVTYKINSASELEIELPKDLAPGKYDVEITSTHGKLTHLQGIIVKAVVPTKEFSFKGEGAWLNYGSLLDLTNIAKQIGSEYTSVKCIVNAADPVVAERLAKRACDYIEANRLRGKEVTYESKSTFKGEGFWVRVVANG